MHRFRITVEPVSHDSPAEPIHFEVDNHDDILAIARSMNGRFDLDSDSSSAFAIGLKLLGEIVLKNRDREPFRQIRPALSDFNGAVKGAATRA